LVKALARAYLWKKELQEGKYPTRMDVARAYRLCPKYVYAIYELNRLSPRIKQAILEGTQPKELKLADMMKNIPVLFEEQERKYGFVREGESRGEEEVKEKEEGKGKKEGEENKRKGKVREKERCDTEG